MAAVPAADLSAVQAGPERVLDAGTAPPPPRVPAPSRLPRRRGPAPAEAPRQELAPAPEPVVQVASESLLPRRTKVAGRAEIRRRQEANLEPLDDSPAVPLDRTPYLPMDVRRVALVSTMMLVLVIAGLVFIH
ncbi:MAG: hypothetical protein ACYDC5_01595 [Candidatus Dormibacteria bacterium]